MQHKNNADSYEPIEFPHLLEFEQYLDSQPFIMYALASILLLMCSLVVSMKFYLYGLIPLALTNFVGAYGDEKTILFLLNVSYAVILLLFKDQINLIR